MRIAFRPIVATAVPASSIARRSRARAIPKRLAEPATMGDPMRPLRWVSKSPAKLAAALVEGWPRGQRQHGRQAAQREARILAHRVTSRWSHRYVREPPLDSICTESAGEPNLDADQGSTLQAVYVTRIKLRYVDHFTDRNGHLRHYFRRRLGPRTLLPGLPGSAEFMAAYQAALMAVGKSGRRPAKPTRGAPGTFDSLVQLYLVVS